MKVFVVEDSRIVRDSLVALLSDIQDVEIVGDADNPDDAFYNILRLQPQVVVLDIKLRGGSGISLLHMLRQQAPSIKTIMLTNYAGPEFRDRCSAIGADYFFDKTGEFEKVKDVLEHLMAAGTTH